jgi:hypothetical protein
MFADLQLVNWTSTIKICNCGPKYLQIGNSLTFVLILIVSALYKREVHSGISGFASSFNWKLTDNINNSTFPTQLAGQAGQIY